MSALGHKRTCAAQNGMSALPSTATEKADISFRPCLLYPRKRTCAPHKLMSALGQERTFCAAKEALNEAADLRVAECGWRRAATQFRPRALRRALTAHSIGLDRYAFRVRMNNPKRLRSERGFTAESPNATRRLMN